MVGGGGVGRQGEGVCRGNRKGSSGVLVGTGWVGILGNGRKGRVGGGIGWEAMVVVPLCRVGVGGGEGAGGRAGRCVWWEAGGMPCLFCCFVGQRRRCKATHTQRSNPVSTVPSCTHT